MLFKTGVIISIFYSPDIYSIIVTGRWDTSCGLRRLSQIS